MKRWDKASIMKQFETSGAIMYRATLDGDYKANNREGEKLTKIFQEFETNRALADACIPELLKSANVVVRTKGAAYCLALNRDTETAQSVLQEIADDASNGIFGFNAKMTLEIWRKQGYLLVYPGSNPLALSK